MRAQEKASLRNKECAWTRILTWKLRYTKKKNFKKIIQARA